MHALKRLWDEEEEFVRQYFVLLLFYWDTVKFGLIGF